MSKCEERDTKGLYAKARSGELKGFTVKGNTILLNNETVPISVLYDIVNQLNNGNVEIIEVEVE